MTNPARGTADLSVVDVADPALYDEGIPHPVFGAMRQAEGLTWNRSGPFGSGFWSVTRYHDLVEVSRNPEVFSSELGHIQIYDIDDDVRAGRASMIDLDPPLHTHLRRLVSKVFTPRHVAGYADAIDTRVSKLVDAIVANGDGDWASGLAAPIPIGVICDILGVPEEDHALMIEMSDHLVSGTGSSELPADAYGNTRPLRELPFGSAAAFGIDEYARRARERVLARPGDDLLSQLAGAEIDGQQLTETEYARFFQLMIFAGNETTRTAMSHMATYLAAFPDEFDRVRRDPSLLPSAVEEVVRYSSPILYFRRTTTRPTVRAGTRTAAGDKVVMWYAAANFGEEVFDDPMRFDVGRPRPRPTWPSGAAGSISAWARHSPAWKYRPSCPTL